MLYTPKLAGNYSSALTVQFTVKQQNVIIDSVKQKQVVLLKINTVNS